jgi:electron transfer flavoprotein alpha subunit
MAGIYIYSDKAGLAAELINFAKKSGRAANLISFSQEEAEGIKDLGADKVFVLNGDSPLIENYGKAAAKFLQKEAAELFAVGATPRGRDIAARTAGYLDCGMVSDVSAISYEDGKIRTERMMYGGAVICSEVVSGLSVVTIPAGKFEAAAGNSTEIITVEATADSRVSLVETAPIVRGSTDITAAEIVVCVGQGMDEEEDMHLARDLAQVLGAEIGCTRGIAEERHWLPVERYIGISGAVIKPNLYISMGVSGQVQHVVGIREAKIIVAVDNNEKAPIFKAADYGIVGDLYEIIPLLTGALKNA